MTHTPGILDIVNVHELAIQSWQEHAAKVEAARDRLREGNRELVAALNNLLTYDRVERPAFRAKPEGAPNSSVRIRQDKLIALEDQAIAALEKAKGTAP